MPARLLKLLILPLCLAGCGQTGPLYLPEPEATPPATPAPTSSPPAAEPERDTGK